MEFKELGRMLGLGMGWVDLDRIFELGVMFKRNLKS
jgi:hypothetical protein